MNENIQDLNVDPERFVPFDTYKPSDQYCKLVENLLPKMWRLKQDYYWTHVHAPFTRHPVQGWKIHISAIPSNAERILEYVIPVCVNNDVEFKFTSDSYILKRSLSKRAARSSSGKFITIYPTDKQCFLRLLEELYVALKNEFGPYVLSDRRYKDSKIIYYRYGGIQSFVETSVYDIQSHFILDETYKYVPDIRGPSYVLPSFIEDINDGIESNIDSELNEDDEFLFNGKYKIKSVIGFSNSGGVYNAHPFDDDSTHVVIKEARPYIGMDASEIDTITHLKKEFRILNKIVNENIAPKPFDIFNEWEHTYLAMEYVSGEALRKYCAKNSKISIPTSNQMEIQKWFDDLRLISINIINAVNILHDKNILFGDISLNNIIIDPLTFDIKLVDFEGSYEVGVDDPINIFTPGFGTTSRWKRMCVEKIDDYFALGCLLTSLFMPIMAIINLKNDIIPIFLKDIKDEYGLPDYFISTILDLISESPCPLTYHIDVLKGQNIQSDLKYNRKSSNYEIICYTGKIESILNYTQNSMNVVSQTRLFPTGPDMTSSVSVDYGALGVAYTFHKLGKSVPTPNDMMSWIFNHIDKRWYTPGLFNGFSGMAWVLTELGYVDRAEQLLKKAQQHRFLYHSMSLGYGAAGYGLTNLKFWQHTNNSYYLNESAKIGDILCDTQKKADNGAFWNDFGNTTTRIGYHHGASGIALFLLYLYSVTNEEKYLTIGKKGLEFDISYGRISNGSISFPSSTAPDTIVYPYLEPGSAGVGTTLLRYYLVTQKQEYMDTLEKIKIGVSHKYAIYPTLFSGLAGIGNYLLDVAQFLKQDDCIERAHRVASGISIFEIHRDSGITYPGGGLSKVDVSYAGGSSGIALFLHRLENGTPNFHFMLDELLNEHI